MTMKAKETLMKQLKVLICLYHKKVMTSHITRDIYEILMFDILISHKYIKETFAIVCSMGKLKWVKYMVEKGVDIDTDYGCGIKKSSEYGHLEVVKYLIQKGADIIPYIGECMNSACHRGHLEIVKYLIEKFHYCHFINISRAAEGGHLHIVKYLVEEKKVDYTEDYRTLNGLVRSGHLDILKYFIEERNFKGSISIRHHPIEEAAFYERIDIMKYLVERGENIFMVDDKFLSYILYRGKTEGVKYILEQQFKDHEYKPDYSRYGNLRSFVEKTFGYH